MKQETEGRPGFTVLFSGLIILGAMLTVLFFEKLSFDELQKKEGPEGS
jgi:hypothetical protein